MFSLITTIISIALAVGVTGATMYYLNGTEDSAATIAAAELLTQSEQIAAAIDMRAFQEKGELSDLNALVTGKYLMQVPLPPEYAFVSGESSVLDWQVPQANPRPVVLVSNKIKASVCSAFNNKMLSDASIPAKANPALRIQCFGAAEPYSVVINPSMNPDQLEAVLPADTGTTTPEPDAQLPVPQTVALDSANLCFKQGVAGSFDFKTVFSASQEATPTTAEVVWAATGTLPAGMSFDTATGVLSGTPTETTSGGDYAVTASYKNAEGKQVYKLLVKGSELEAIHISRSEEHTCAVTPQGGVKCWGSNSRGKVGQPENGGTTFKLPKDVLGLESGITQVAVGWYNSCALTADGTVKCWGSDNAISPTYYYTPYPIVGLPATAKAITTGKNHTCALLITGDVYCWGNNQFGQLYGSGAGTSSVAPVRIPVSNITAISAGFWHTCGLTGLSSVVCWGHNSAGELGNSKISTSYGTLRLTPVENLTEVKSIHSGTHHSCAVQKNGVVKCWGQNNFGQVGAGSISQAVKTPTPVIGLPTGAVADIKGGDNHTCALMYSGSAYCWGRNHVGQLGDGTGIDSLKPVLVTAADISYISSGPMTVCLIDKKSNVKCWGRNMYGYLGDGTSINRTTPVAIMDPTPVTAQTCTDITLTPTDGSTPSISGTISLTPATLPEFKVGEPAIYNFAALYKDSLNTTPNMADVTWSGVGTLPAGLTLDPATGVLSGTPTEKGVVSYTVKATYKGSNSGQQTYQVVVQEGSNKFKQIDSSNSYGMACGVKTNGSVHCWHVSDTYMTRDAVPAPETSTAVSGLTSGVAAVTVGADYICALMDSGGVKCLGANDSGQLGNGNNIAQQSPVDVVGLSSGVKSISAGHRQTCAVLTSGSVKCWGSDEYGAAGLGVDALGHAIGSNIPVTVAGLETGVKALDASYTRTCALMTSGGVKCWGNGWRGGPDANGYSTLAWTTTPQDIVGISNAVEITTTDFYTGCALTATGGVKCWGLRGYTGTSEILGFSSSEADESPRDVIGLTSGVKSISRSCALLNTGGVQCWGDGGNKLFPGWNLPKDMSGATEGVNSLGGSCVVTTSGVAKCWGVIMNSPGPLSK